MSCSKPCRSSTRKTNPPKLTLILVTEQTQYAQMQYLEKYLKGGLGLLWNKGLNYTNATLSHVTVDTGPSHSGWSTGSYSSTHGIVDNEFYCQGVKQYHVDDYTPTSPYTLTYVPNTSLGNPNGQVYPLWHPTSYGTGEGAKYLLTDTLADQLVMHSTHDVRKEFYFVTNVGQGEEPANVLAGQLGIPFYFDEVAGGYTTSQAWIPGAMLQIQGANGSGYGALAALTVVNGVITGVIMENGGVNYQTPLTLTAINPTFDKTGQPKPPKVVATFSYTMKTQLQITGSIAGTTLTVSSTNTPVTIGTVLGSVGNVIAGTVIVAQLTSTTFTVSISQNVAAGTAMAEQFGGAIASIQVVSGGDGYDGGLPDWVVEWNNKQNFPSLTSYTNRYTYPPDSPCYTNIPLAQNFSHSYNFITGATPDTNTLNETYPITYAYPNTPPLEQTQGTGATAIATLAVVAVFQGYISGTELVVPNAPTTGSISIGNVIQVQLMEPGFVPAGTTLVIPNTQVVAWGSGTTGLAGKYTVYPIQTMASQNVGSATNLVTFVATNGTIGQGWLTNGGQGYTYSEGYAGVTITGIVDVISGSPRPGASPRGLLAAGSTSTTNGVVSSFEVTNAGNGYGPNPVVSIYPISSGADYPYYNYPFDSYQALGNLMSFTKRLIQKRSRETEELVVFINPFINHDFSFYHGSFAVDTLDSYYQYDKQLGRLFRWIYKQFDPKDVLLGWVTCEGNLGILGYWYQRGYKTIRNVDMTQVEQLLDQAIYVATKLSGIVKAVSISDVWFGPTYFEQTADTQQLICEAARDAMRQISGVKSVFITHELLDGRYVPQSLEESYLILEAYPGRSGQLKYLSQPMSGIGYAPVGYGTLGSTSWDSGCHSPLCLFRKGVLENREIHEPVQVERLPLTLAEILRVPRPTGAPRILGPLPGVFE